MYFLSILFSSVTSIMDRLEVNDTNVMAAIVIGVLVVLLSVVLLQSRESGTDISIGLKREEALSDTAKTSTGGKPVDTRVLHPVQFKSFRLVNTTQTSHNTKLLRFEIPEGRALGLPIGKHISVMVMIDGNKVIRSYTPVSKPDEEGYFELLMKRYTYGKMSSHLFNMKVGDNLQVRGPVGRFKYSTNMYSTIGFVCGGTGLTPCLQVIREILEGSNAHDENTKLVMLYQNRTEEDILIKESLCALQDQYSDRLQVYFYLSSPSASWGRDESERRGYITEECMQALLPHVDTDLVGLCGPSGFNEAMVKKLESVGYDKDTKLYVW